MKTIPFDRGRVLQILQTTATWNKFQGLKEQEFKTTISHAYFFNQWIIFKPEIRLWVHRLWSTCIYMFWGWRDGWPRGTIYIRSDLWGHVVNYNMARMFTITIHTSTDWHVISHLPDIITGPLRKALTKYLTTLLLLSFQQLIYLIALVTLLYTTSKGQKINSQPQERRYRTSVTSLVMCIDKELMVGQGVAEPLCAAPCPALNAVK